MGGSDGNVPRDEDPDPHEGSTGDQLSGGSVSSDLLSITAITPAAAAMRTKTGRRFTTFSVLPCRDVQASHPMTLEIDHVVFAVTSLEAASRVLETEHGLASLPGGRHTGHGTANRIVPLGTAYLELVAVVDRAEAATSSFGRWVTENAAGKLTPHLLCLRTDDLDTLTRSLGIESIAMSRKRPDGTELRWKLAGLERALRDGGRPFFIEWEADPSDHPGRSTLAQASPGTSVEVSLSGDSDRLARWLGDVPGLTLIGGERGTCTVVIQSDEGEIAL